MYMRRGGDGGGERCLGMELRRRGARAGAVVLVGDKRRRAASWR